MLVQLRPSIEHRPSKVPSKLACCRFPRKAASRTPQLRTSNEGLSMGLRSSVMCMVRIGPALAGLRLRVGSFQIDRFFDDLYHDLRL